MNQPRKQRTSRIILPVFRTGRWICILILIWVFTMSSVSQDCQKNSPQGGLIKNITQLIWNNETEQLENLLDENPGLIGLRLKNEETLLTIAAWQGNPELAKYLVENGIDVNMRNKWDNTALHNAAQRGNTEIVSLLLAHSAAIDARGTSGNTPLAFAALDEHPETAKLLLDAGCLPDTRNDYNQTPLLMASWNGNPKLAWMLTAKGADVNHDPGNGNSVLHNLAANGNLESVKIALAKGADPNRTDENGYLPLHNAAINRNSDVVKELVKHTADIDLQEKTLGNTALHIAAINGDLISSKTLVEAGAKTGSRNNSGKIPADYAVKYGYTDLVKYFVDYKLAPEASLKLAQEYRDNALASIAGDEAKVIYCGHSGWAVETENHFLIFDYWSEAHSPDPALVNGSISPEELIDKNVIVFVSHDHTDHYDPAIHAWADKIRNIHYVYGFRPEESWIYKEKGYEGPDYVYIDDDHQTVIDGVEVTSFKSTDSGQGFLVVSDGISIYHPGDHAWFAEEDEQPFKKEVDFIAGKTDNIDIAFLPVTGCPSRWKKEYIIAGFMYSLEKLNPDQVYPMHALHREYTLKEFAELAEEKQNTSQIVCTENIGDAFIFNKSMVAAK